MRPWKPTSGTSTRPRGLSYGVGTARGDGDCRLPLEQLKQSIDTATEPWGVQVVGVESKDVGLPDTMKRAMARQADAERERRAKVIAAEGEYQAAERSAEAAHVISRERGR